ESLKLLYLQKPSKIASILNISLNKANVIYQSLHSLKLIKQIKSESVDTYIITYFDPHYPTQLKTIPDPPYVIYAKGNIHLLKEKKMLSVIGTRKPTIQGKSKVNHFIKPLIENNWLIVSGMARGIDTYAHDATLKFKGNTISVLGSGFNHIYQKENKNLYEEYKSKTNRVIGSENNHNYPKEKKNIYEEIKNKGLIITEYPPNTKPERYHFPERNRIISGLSKGTIVVESGERSGTLITVDQALE